MIDKMLKSGRRSTIWTVLLTLLATAPGFFLSLEDSEIWGITSSRRFLDEFGTISSAHIKPLFSLLFGLIVKVAPTDWDALFFSRIVTIGLATIGLFCLFRLILSAYQQQSQRLVAFAITGLALSMPIFLMHFSKARSDTVAVSLVLMALLAINRSHHKKSLFLIAATAVLLVTPKSLDLVFVLAAFTLKSHFDSIAKRLTWLISPVAVLFVLAFLFGREPLVKALTYWIDSYREAPITSYEHWFHVKMAMQSAWMAASLLTVGIFASLYLFSARPRRAALSSVEFSFILSGVIVAVFVLIHSQKYPFFLASRLPFLLMLAIPGWVWLLDSTLGKTPVSRAVLMAVALVSINFAVSTNRIHREQLFALDLQKKVHTNLLVYLEKANVSSYWDAIGLFPKQNRIFHYPSPGDRTNEEMPAYLESSKPVIVIRTPKMNLLEPYLFVWLQRKYAPVSSEIHARIARLFEHQTPQNCELRVGDVIQRASEEGLRDRDLILLVKTKSNPVWNQVPFRQIQKGEPQDIAQIDSSISATNLHFVGCRDAETQYSVSEAGPWRARPVSYNSTLFGYDGRL